MPNNDPFSSTISWPGSRDNFPSVVDVGTTGGSNITDYTTVWASHFNKVANVVESLQTALRNKYESAATDGSLKGITNFYEFSIPLWELMDFANNLWNPILPTNVLPFEFIITTDNDDYSNYPLYDPATGKARTIHQMSDTDFNNMFGSRDIYNLEIMAAVSLSHNNLDTDQSYMTNTSVNAWVVTGNKTVIVRGAVVDHTCPSIPTMDALSSPPNWTDMYTAVLHCTLYGVQP